MGDSPDPIFDAVESAVVTTVRAVRRGTYGEREYRVLVPNDVAADAWEFYANDERWGMAWEDALNAAREAGKVATERRGGRDRVGVLA